MSRPDARCTDKTETDRNTAQVRAERLTRSTKLKWSAVFIALTTTARCHQPLQPLAAGVVPRLSPDLASGQVVGVVVDGASRSALRYAQVLLYTDTGSATPRNAPAAAYTDILGRFVLHAGKGGTYRLEVLRPGHQRVQESLVVPDSGGVFVTVTLARDSVACATWPDLCP